jgi:purine-binding chemotaxis protein CheW
MHYDIGVGMTMAQNSTAAHDIFDENHSENAQYFTFSLNGEEYGVDILSVVEVKVWEDVTTMPDTAAYVKGVLNLRGTVVPIIDLRMYYAMESIEYTAETVILILKITVEGKEQTIGLVVDSVSDVMSIDHKQVHSTDEFKMSASTNSIIGLATLDDRNIIMLDVSKILTETQLGEIVNQYPM